MFKFKSGISSNGLFLLAMGVALAVAVVVDTMVKVNNPPSEE